MKPQIYKVGINWVLWVPGVRVYRFGSWSEALAFALEEAMKRSEETQVAAAATTR